MEMKKRTIMIFPEFNNMKYIDELRGKYDPLVNKVRPHITLVFPFESAFTKSEIYEILNCMLCRIKPFEVEVQGLSVQGEWLFLDLAKGKIPLIEIHNILYANEFAAYKPDWLKKYMPHITVGKFNSKKECENVYLNEQGFNKIFTSLVNEVTVEIIGDNEESIIEIEYPLYSNKHQ